MNQIERTQRLKFKLEPAFMLAMVTPPVSAGGTSTIPGGGGGAAGYHSHSASNSRRGSYTETPASGRPSNGGFGPHISIFTTGDGSATSSRSSSPSRSSRRSSYNSQFGGAGAEIRGRAASSSFLNVALDEGLGKSKTSELHSLIIHNKPASSARRLYFSHFTNH